jgi:hypothetical protein
VTEQSLSERDEANVTALALVRDAVSYSDHPSPPGTIMETLQPYLMRAWAAQDPPPADDAAVDATPVFTVLLASLAQVAGVAYWRYLEAKHGRDFTKDQVLDSLLDFQSRFLEPPGTAEGTS